MTTFKHQFFGWLDAEAKRWTNSDGSKGGIVALDATVDASIQVPSDAVVGPGASIGYGASIGAKDWFMTVGPVGSRAALALAVHSEEHGLRWWVGCQHGLTTEALLGRVAGTHGDNEHAVNYRAAIAFVEGHPALAARRATV